MFTIRKIKGTKNEKKFISRINNDVFINSFF